MRRNEGQVFQWYRANVHSEIAQFQRSLGRVEALMRSGRFWQLAEKTRAAMQRMLAVLYRRLSELQRRAVMRFAGAFLALGLLAAPLAAEPVTFVEQTGAGNPFDGITFEQRAAIAFTDFDGDGDQDAVVGSSRYEAFPAYQFFGDVYLYRKTGLSLEEDSTGNPFGVVSGEYLEGASPAVGDVDSDGDTDVVVGTYYYSYDGYTDGKILLYQRNPADVFSIALGGGNPLHGIGLSPTDPFFPAFADIDGDGDEDLFVSGNNDYNIIRFYRNDAGSPPAFTESSGDNPFADQTFGDVPAPAFVDLDNDGDLDAFVGHAKYGQATISFFENIGSATSPAFVERTGDANPLEGFFGTGITDFAQPAFVDFDEDGDMDAFVGGSMWRDAPYYDDVGRIQYFRNTTPAVVTADAHTVMNTAGYFVTVRSNKSAGSVYVVLDGVPQSTVEEIEAAITAHKAAKATVGAANAPVQVLTAGLVPGTYHAYAVSGGASPELSARGTNAITISAVVVPPVEEPPVVVTYPASEGLDSSDVWIEKVTIGSLATTSGNDGGYSDFTASTISMARGSTITVELVPGFKPGARYSIRRLAQQIWRVWVDWNADGDFADLDEEALVGGPSHRSLTATITVPETALLGSTRIRVSMRYAGDGAPLAEGTFAHGEVEDYTATVTE